MHELWALRLLSLDRPLPRLPELRAWSLAYSSLASRSQIVEATRAFVEDVRCALDEPLSSAVLRRLAEVHPTAEECRRAIIDGERGSGLPGPPRAPCDQT